MTEVGGIGLYPIVLFGAVFLGLVKLIVIVSQMHSAIKVLEENLNQPTRVYYNGFKLKYTS